MARIKVPGHTRKGRYVKPYTYERDRYGIVKMQSRRTGRVFQFGSMERGYPVISSRGHDITDASTSRILRLVSKSVRYRGGRP